MNDPNDPNHLYSGTLKRLNINSDELGYILQGYFKNYSAEVQHTNDLQMSVGAEELQEHINLKLADKIAKDIISGNLFQSKIISEYIPYNDTYQTTLSFETLDINQFNRVFRPERVV